MRQTHDDGSVTLEVNISLGSDGSIRLAVPNSSEPPVRIKNDAERPSGHPRLFKFLAQYLREDGDPAPSA